MRIDEQIIDMPMCFPIPMFSQPSMPVDTACNAAASASDIDVSSCREGNHSKRAHGYCEGCVHIEVQEIGSVCTYIIAEG